MIPKRFPFYKQLDQKDCGPTCIRIIASYYGRLIPVEILRARTNLTRQGVSIADISEASESIGIHSLPVKVDYKTLTREIPLPCIAHWRNNHFVVVYKVKDNKVYVSDPAHGLLTYSQKEFVQGWAGQSLDGYLIVMEPKPEFYEATTDEKNEFGFRFLMKYFKPHKRYLVQLILGLAMGSLFQLIFPFLAQSVVDYGINYQNVSFIYLILIAQLVLFLSQSTVELIRGWILLHMTSRINVSLISDFLLKLMRLPIAFFDSKNTGDIIQRIQDHNRIQSFISGTTLATLFSIFNVIIFGGVLAYYSITIASVFFIGSVLYVGWTVLFLKRRAALDYKRFAQSSENQNSLYQLVTGMQEIKLNGSERRRRWEWESIQAQLFKVSVKGLALSQTQSTGSSFLFQLQSILITFVTATSVISGDLTLGMMLSVQYIIGQLSGPINNLIGFIQAAQDARISLTRLSEIHSNATEDDSPEGFLEELPENKTIRIRDLSFRYGGKSSALVLNNLNFEIPEGKITAIVGSSGSGKTTLLKLLLKFYEPSEGTVTIGDTPLKNISAKKWRKACGTVMQDGYLFNDSVARNITESDSENVLDKKRLFHAVTIANIREFIESLAGGYNMKIGSRGMNISAGQKQRILIARAVYKNPEYILFDEATSALDSTNEVTIMNNLREFYKGKTVVIVAHRLSTVKSADQIIVLEKGNIIEKGRHYDLTAQRGTYFNLVKNQLELEQ